MRGADYSRTWAVLALSGALVLLGGCAQPPAEPDFSGTTALTVTGPDADWATAAGGAGRLLITVPESSGCPIEARITDVDEAEKTVYVALDTGADGEDPCAANLYYATKELPVEPDVRDFTVNVQVDP